MYSERIRLPALLDKVMSASDAAAAVRQSDKEREFYLRSFYDVREEPTDYDLVLNTDRLSAEQAAATILAAARA